MADIGATLREARTRGRISIDEVEADTKIRARYLRAIENEQWDLLPGPVYAKSFLRTYGDYLGLDSRLLVDEYKRAYEPSDHELRPISPLTHDRERPSRRPALPSWMPIVLVLAAVVVALGVLGSLNTANKTPPAGGRTTASHSHARPHHPAPHPASRKTPAVPKPPTVTLQLAATAQVYVCVENERGTKLIPGVIFTPGQTIPTETARKLLLTLGNASVQMKVNGVPVRVLPSTNAIGLLVAPSGTRSLPPAQQPTCT